MAVSIAKLAIQFVADTSGMVAGTKKAESALGGFVGKVKGIGGQLAGAFGFIGAGAAVMGFVQTIRKSFKEIDALGDTSKKLGIGVENLQLLGFAAGQSGVQTETLNKAFAKMNDTIGEASLGSKNAIAAFERLGLSAATLKAQNPKDAFLSIADALSKVPDQATRTKLAMDVFGRGATELMPLLMEGAAGIDALFKERGAMGLISAEEVARIQAMDDAWNKMDVSIAQIAGTIAVELAPAMEAFAKQVTELQPEIEKLFQGIGGKQGEGFQIQQDAAKIGEGAVSGDLAKVQEGIVGWSKFLTGQGLVEDVIKSGAFSRPAELTPEQLKEIGDQTLKQWEMEDKAAAGAMPSPLEAMATQMNEQFGTGLGAAGDGLQDNFAAGKDADKLFGRLKKPVLDTVGDLFSTIDRKANAALGGITGNVGDSALGNLLDSAEMGLQSFADASGMAQANVEALSAAPVIGQAAALQRGTAEAFSTARANAADAQKASEMKEQQKQSKLLEKIEKNTGINTTELQQATF
jgi:hypothetical protein